MRRAFTSFQLMTILEENHHSFLIVEHDSLLRTPRGWWARMAQALRQTSREAKVLLQHPGAGSSPEGDSRAGRYVFCNNEPVAAKGQGKAEARMRGEQRTLEAYS